MPSSDKNKKGFFTVLAFLLIFALPPLVAGILYHYRDHFHFQTSNHGQLIQPARAIAQWQFDTIDAKTNSLQALDGKWVLWYQSDSCCRDKGCQNTITKIRQIRRTLGKDLERTASIVSLQASCPNGPEMKTIAEHGMLAMLLTPSPAQSKNLQQHYLDHQVKLQSKHIYIVDPNGYLMMVYPSHIKPLALYEDIKHLLKASQIG